MGIQEALAGAFALFTVQSMLYLLLGVAIAQVIVILPGLGGHFAVAVILPFALLLEPAASIGLYIGASVTTGTGNTITSVLFGVPGSPTGIATLFDGYPLAKKGEGARAVAAGLSASAVGGIIGAVALAVLFPFVRPITLSLSSPEFFALILVAVIFMAYVGEGDLLKALVAGGAGLMLSLVGQELSTGAVRYSLGSLYLWDGIALVPFFIGLYGVSEMMELIHRGGSIARDRTVGLEKGGVLKGMLDPFRRPRATIVGSIVGTIIGIIPGLGGSTAQFVSYTTVARVSKNRANFGKGEIEGVIGSDAATNANDAGQQLPTLGFGIPGTAGAAILLSLLMVHGVQPGPRMLVDNADFIWFIILLYIPANLFATSLCLVAIRPLAKLTLIPSGYLVTVILVLCFLGAFVANFSLGDIVTATVFGVIGYLMLRTGYSRATMIVGFVLGSILERHYLLSMRLYGLEFLTRPIVMVLLGLALITIFNEPARRIGGYLFRSLRAGRARAGSAERSR